MNRVELMGTKVCVKCDLEKPISNFRKYRNACRECLNKASVNWRKANPDSVLSHQRKYLSLHRVQQREKAKIYYSNHKDERKVYTKNYRANHVDELNASRQEYRLKVKEKVFSHYGGVCACCGEANVVFLTIDHKNGDGAAHRKQMRCTGHEMYRWLKRNKYPDTFQVLCWNCNSAKHFAGVCPHEAEKARDMFYFVGGAC